MSLPLFDPELLRAFVAVAEEASFTRAAARLHRTQAAVSMQIKRLEALAGVGLLRRSTAHVALSHAGEGFLADARRILALNAEAAARLSLGRQAGHVRIGVMEDYGSKVLPSLLARAQERFPLLEVAVEIGLTSGMVGRLGSAFDIVIAMHPEGATGGTLLRAETPAWIAAQDHAPEACEPLPVALSDHGCLFRTWAERALNASGRAWRLAYVSRSLAAVEAIVAEGLAVTVVKRSMIGEGFRVVPPGDALPKLPGAELRLHLAPRVPPPVALFAEQLREGLSAR